MEVFGNEDLKTADRADEATALIRASFNRVKDFKAVHEIGTWLVSYDPQSDAEAIWAKAEAAADNVKGAAKQMGAYIELSRGRKLSPMRHVRLAQKALPLIEKIPAKDQLWRARCWYHDMLSLCDERGRASGAWRMLRAAHDALWAQIDKQPSFDSWHDAIKELEDLNKTSLHHRALFTVRSIDEAERRADVFFAAGKTDEACATLRYALYTAEEKRRTARQNRQLKKPVYRTEEALFAARRDRLAQKIGFLADQTNNTGLRKELDAMLDRVLSPEEKRARATSRLAHSQPPASASAAREWARALLRKNGTQAACG
jgi:hypothetical protein